MQNFPSSRSPRRASMPRGFTLVELLVVVAIIAVLGGLSVRLLGGATGSNGPQGAANMANSLLMSAREEAIMRRTNARLIIDNLNPPTAQGHYLHRMTVAYFNPAVTISASALSAAANWIQSGTWEILPSSTYVYYTADTVGMSAQTNGTVPSGSGMQVNFGGTLSGGSSGAGYDYIEFNQAGQVTKPPGTPYLQLVVAPGFMQTAQSPNQLQLTGTAQLYGFAIFHQGRTEFFQTLNSMR